MAWNDKIKAAFEWVEHGKTLVDGILWILGSLGGGTLVRAWLIQHSQISRLWITPIWLLTSAAIVWVLSALSGRRKRPSAQSTGQASSQDKLMTPATTFDPAKVFAQSYDSPLAVEAENNVRMGLKGMTAQERENMLSKLIGVGIVNYLYDIVWAYIFKSQIDLLMELNRRTLLLSEAQGYYQQAATEFPVLYKNYSFEQWLEFLRSQVLILMLPENRISITVRGKDFLKYLLHFGRYATDRKF